MSIRLSAALAGAALIIAAGFTISPVPADAADDIAAKVQSCNACHGQNGTPIAPNIPVIWGQQENYLVKQIHDYRADDRHNAIMGPLAKAISLDDSRPVAAYFAAKPWPAAKAAPASAAPPVEIAQKIAMCKACHQPNFEGGAPAPRLAGLSYEYLVVAMKKFADGERTNNLDMPGFMKGLSEAERDAMAKYLAGL